MRTVDVLIVFEHTARELESAILLEAILNKKGFTTEIVQEGWNEGLAHLTISPRAVIVPWCYDEKEYSYFTKYKGANNGKLKIYNLHCEQLSNINALELMLPDKDAKNVYHLVWGKYFGDLLLRQQVDKKLIYATGSPRLDFFRDEFSCFSASKKELATKYNLILDKPWILVIGNYNGGLLTNTGLDNLEKKGYKKIKQLADLTQKTYYENLKWIKSACNDSVISNAYEIIYRPHPSEIVTQQLEEINEYTNFHIIKEMAIRDWIVNSDIAFSWNSTSATEVAAAGTPIFNCRPFSIPEDMQIPLLEKIEKISTEEQFLEVIKTFKEMPNINESFKKEISYYYDVSGNAATINIVNAITETLSSDYNWIDGKYSLIFGFRKALNFGLKRILYLLNLLPKTPKYMTLHDDYIGRVHMNDFRKKAKDLVKWK